MEEKMTILDGAIYTIDGQPFGKIMDIKEFTDCPEVDDPLADFEDDIAAKLELPKGILFECNSFKFDYCPWALQLLGLKPKKKPMPVRKRLLKKLRDKYGWYHSHEYTLSPAGDGNWEMQMDAGTVTVSIGKE